MVVLVSVSWDVEEAFVQGQMLLSVYWHMQKQLTWISSHPHWQADILVGGLY